MSHREKISGFCSQVMNRFNMPLKQTFFSTLSASVGVYFLQKEDLFCVRTFESVVLNDAFSNFQFQWRSSYFPALGGPTKMIFRSLQSIAFLRSICRCFLRVAQSFLMDSGKSLSGFPLKITSSSAGARRMAVGSDWS